MTRKGYRVLYFGSKVIGIAACLFFLVDMFLFFHRFSNGLKQIDYERILDSPGSLMLYPFFLLPYIIIPLLALIGTFVIVRHFREIHQESVPIISLLIGGQIWVFLHRLVDWAFRTFPGFFEWAGLSESNLSNLVAIGLLLTTIPVALLSFALSIAVKEISIPNIPLEQENPEQRIP